MGTRSSQLSEFLARAAAAILPGADALPGAGPAARRIFAAMAAEGAPGHVESQSLPVCDRLGEAYALAAKGPEPVRALAQAIAALSPDLRWQRRKGAEKEGALFFDGHANALVVGPGGLEERSDVQIGISFMVPRVRYPDHSHPPEEVYVSLASGEWRNDIEDWHTPGPGGLVYNPPAITHAMRTGSEQLLAVWCLRVGNSQ